MFRRFASAASRSALCARSSVPSRTIVAPQMKAPAFTAKAVVNGKFKDVSLNDYAGKYVVLFFYPLDFTFVCPTEITAFSDAAESFRKAGAEILACSVDSHFCHYAWTQVPRSEGGLGPVDLPLLADVGGEIARSYGVLLPGANVALRGLFIINGDGVVRASIVNDLPVGRNVDEVLRLLDAFKHTDAHGEVCPANWSKGSKTMIPDTQKSKEYFKLL